MHYHDFSKEDQKLINTLLEQIDFGSVLPEDLQDNEVFFRTKEEVKQIMKPWLDSPGSYGYMAKELFEYFDGTELEDKDMQIHQLDWASVCRVGDGRYLFWSNSWSDSGLFFAD